MALDRQSIARRDFPAARRGYDPAAVDRHLAAVADEVEELRAAQHAGAALAGQTSEQVRAIIEAAEAGAAGIREGATADAREHVARVAKAADGLRERIDALERELTGVLGALRTRRRPGAGRPRRPRRGHAPARGDRGWRRGGRAPARGPEPIAPSALGATLGQALGRGAGRGGGRGGSCAGRGRGGSGRGRRSGRSGHRRRPGRSAAAPMSRARGSSRCSGDGRPAARGTDAYLAEHYDLPDRAALLEQVYAIAPKG